MSQYTESEIEILKKYYPNGGCRVVRKYINRTKDSIRHKAKSLGVTRDSGFLESQISINSLLDIERPEGVYLLGFLWGDGSIGYYNRGYRISTRFATKDFNDIKEIFKNWHIYNMSSLKSKYPTWKDMTHISISHKKLYKFLEKNDYKIKSVGSPTKLLEFIRSDLKHYFFRGWFDADGTCSCLKQNGAGVSISGSYFQDWMALENLASELNLYTEISKTMSLKGHKSSLFSILTTCSVVRFMDYIYQGEIFGLKRKHNEYLRWIERKLTFFNNKTSLYKGVCKQKGGKYLATLSRMLNEKHYTEHLGIFDYAIDAARAYDKRAIELFGKYHPTNFGLRNWKDVE